MDTFNQLYKSIMVKYHERHKKAVGRRLSRDSGNQYHVFNVQCLQSGHSTLGTQKYIYKYLQYLQILSK